MGGTRIENNTPDTISSPYLTRIDKNKTPSSILPSLSACSASTRNKCYSRTRSSECAWGSLSGTKRSTNSVTRKFRQANQHKDKLRA